LKSVSKCKQYLCRDYIEQDEDAKTFHSLIMTVDEALLTEIAYSSKIQPSTEELMKLFGMWGEALNDFCSKQTGKTLIQCMTFAIDPANNK
jgi:hypothetical protein